MKTILTNLANLVKVKTIVTATVMVVFTIRPSAARSSRTRSC